MSRALCKRLFDAGVRKFSVSITTIELIQITNARARAR